MTSVYIYQRSLTGSLQTKTTGSGVWNYGYDLTDQLTNAALFAGSVPLRENSYSYDAMGNRLRTTENTENTEKVQSYLPNSLNQYTSITSSVYSVSSVVIRTFFSDVIPGAYAGPGRNFQIAGSLTDEINVEVEQCCP
jgi:hypothetical protein